MYVSGCACENMELILPLEIPSWISVKITYPQPGVITFLFNNPTNRGADLRNIKLSFREKAKWTQPKLMVV